MKRSKSRLRRRSSKRRSRSCWDGYERVPGTKFGDKGSCRKSKLIGGMRRGDVVNPYGTVAEDHLINAVLEGNNFRLRGLLQRISPANANAKTKEGGYTALMFAVWKNNYSSVELLLSYYGVDVNASDEDGTTALMMAAREGHTAFVEMLLAAPGIDVNAKNEWGDTALTRAAQEGHTAIVELLLAAPDIDVNASDEWGDTALMVAERRGHTDVVRVINSFLVAQAMNRWILRHRYRQSYRQSVYTLMPPKVNYDVLDYIAAFL